MHYLRHKHMVRALRLGSFFFVLSALSLFCFLGGAVYILIERELNSVIFAGGSLALVFLFRILSLIFCARAQCQLCQGSLLSLQTCAMHRNASSLLKSYRLRLAVTVLCRPSFTCIFCGETFSTNYVDPKVRKLSSDLLSDQNRLKEAQKNPRKSKIVLPRRNLD